MMMKTQAGSYVLQLLPLLFLAVALPWYGRSRSGVLFGVTVPLEFAVTSEAIGMLRRYRYSVFVVTLTIAAGVGAYLWLTPASSWPGWLLPAAELLEIVSTFLLWRRQANAVRIHAAKVPLERHTELMQVNTSLPIAVMACSLLPLAGTALWLRLHWNQIPQKFALHWNAMGAVDRWGTRSFEGVYGTLIAGAMTLLMLTLGAMFIARVSGPLRSQRRRALVPMAATSWLLAGVFCFLGLRPVLRLAPHVMTIAGAMYGLAIFALVLWQLKRSELAPFSKSEAPYDSTPDSKWHAGIIYFNAADAAVLVPKRFGWGWTLNFARPAAWMFVGATLLFLLAMRLL
ncbi:MAG: DUF1648 domain-containing protein [Acidobacteria bacterium]|nr:DUF1648 domain-containing protein [Acidobacteriota bacterium]